MSHPNIPKHEARPWLAGEVQEPDDEPGQEDDSESPYGDEQQQEQEQ